MRLGAAAGTVEKVLARHTGIVKLSTGGLVLIHPVSGDGDANLFLPCVYGYATTIRRAQGATLTCGCLYFDHSYPPERGYGYVGVSRFKTRAGVYHYGRIRRTDWLPVGGPGAPAEQEQRPKASREPSEVAASDSDEDACLAGDGIDVGLRALREGLFWGADEEVHEELWAGSEQDSDLARDVADLMDAESTDGEEADGASESESDEASSRDFEVQPRLMYHEVHGDDADGLLA